MDEEIREVLEENEAKRNRKQKPELNPLEYVTIPIKEYRKMIRKIERMKAQLVDSEKVITLTKEKEQYNRWWREEGAKAAKLESEITELRTNLDEAKKQIAEMVGLGELEQVKLAEMQFEKGVINDTDTSGS